MFVKAVGKPLEIVAKLNELAGFPENEDVELYEVLISIQHLSYIIFIIFTFAHHLILEAFQLLYFFWIFVCCTLYIRFA
jgi:hypothetical protein